MLRAGGSFISPCYLTVYPHGHPEPHGWTQFGAAGGCLRGTTVSCPHVHTPHVHTCVRALFMPAAGHVQRGDYAPQRPARRCGECTGPNAGGCASNGRDPHRWVHTTVCGDARMSRGFPTHSFVVDIVIRACVASSACSSWS